MPKPKVFNPRWEKFCHEYVCNGNATAAYIAAGFSPNGAQQAASLLLSKHVILSRIAEMRRESEKTLGISRERVAQELARLGFSDVKRVVKWNQHGLRSIASSDNLPDDDSRTIKSISETITTSTTPEGHETVNRKIKFELHEKRAALDSLAKMYGYNEPDKVDQTVRVDPVDTTDEVIRRLEARDAAAAARSDREPDAGPA